IEVDTEFITGQDEGSRADQRLFQAYTQNERLLKALREAREEIEALRDEVDKLAAPPSTYGVYLAAHEDDTVHVLTQGPNKRDSLRAPLEAASLRPGQELGLDQSRN